MESVVLVPRFWELFASSITVVKHFSIINKNVFRQAAFQSNPDSYNGAIRDKYCWSQNYDDVDVKIPVQKSVARAKQVNTKCC